VKIFKSGIHSFHISNSCLREERRGLKSLSRIPLDKFIAFSVDTVYVRLGIGYEENQKKFLEFCKKFSNTGNNFSVGILNAHGDNFFGKWVYYDGLFPKSVQSWVDKMDGVYDLLLICVCNPGHKNLFIRKSTAVVPTDDVCMMLNIAGVKHKLVIPGQGTVSFDKKSIDLLPNLDLLSSPHQIQL